MSVNVKPILIVSTGRTGTIFFANLLRELCPQAESYHERGFSRPLNILTNCQLAGLIPKSMLTSAWKLLKDSDLRKAKKEFYFETNNFLYGIVVIAPELYPGLRVVHIIRDPRTYVRSHLNWSSYRLKSYIANHLTPFWQPNPFLMKQMTFKAWTKLTQFERFCWIWDFKNRLIGSLEKSTTPYLRVYFEDFFGGPDPELHMNRILLFAGLPEVKNIRNRFTNPINETKNRTFPSWIDWETSLCARLYMQCGELMHDYGYGQEPEWIEKVERGKNINKEDIQGFHEKK
jgi:hypothetical protein